MNFIEMWEAMGPIAKGIGIILVIMSMISFGVAIERIYTFTQARKQSKLYAPQVAKHLKDGRLKDAIAISSSKNYRYSHLAKVVLAGLQEYQFQQEAGGQLSREDLVDTVRRAIHSEAAPKAIGPYSQAVEVPAGRMVFLSGQVPIDPATQALVTGDIAAQTDRVMKNLQAVLAAANLAFEHVVRCTIYLIDLNDFGAVNEAYGRYFEGSPPARATVQVAGLPKGARVEIDAIAVGP